MIKYICDKCKKQIQKKKGLNTDQLINFYNTNERLNVCVSCYDKILLYAKDIDKAGENKDEI